MTKEQYLEPEIRDGYQVSAVRKKVWFCELEIAAWFCNVCKKYDLKYFLIGGSAIGAVRHNGFIPWDDDLDIGMLRSDFDKFRKVSIDELPEDYKMEYGVLDGNIFSSLLTHKLGIITIYSFYHVHPKFGLLSAWKMRQMN